MCSVWVRKMDGRERGLKGREEKSGGGRESGERQREREVYTMYLIHPTSYRCQQNQ